MTIGHNRVLSPDALRFANALSRAIGDLQAVAVELDAILRTLPPETTPRHRQRLEHARRRIATGIAQARQAQTEM